MRQSYRILCNGVVTYGATLIQGGVGFLLVPFIVTRIGKESYGVVLLAMSALSMIEIFGMALTQAVAKHVAAEDARGERKLLNVIFSSSLLWFLLIGLVGSAAAALAGLNFSRLFPDVSPELARDGRVSMFIMSGTIAACLVGDVWKGVLSGVQRYDIISTLSSIRSLGRAICVVAYFLLMGPALLPVVIIFAGTHVLERIGLAAACHWTVRELRASPKFITRLGLRMIAAFATFLLVATIANLLVSDILKVVIGRELGLSALTEYGVALVLITFANGVVRSFQNVLMPVASKYQELGNEAIIRKLLVHGTKYSFIVALACVGVTVPFLPSLYRLWMGTDFVDLTEMTTVMFAGQAIVCASVCSREILKGLGRVKLVCAISLVWAGAAISAVCMHLHFWTGATLMSTVVIMAIGRSAGGVAVVAHGLKVTGVKWRQLVVQSYAKPLLVCCIVTFLGFGCVHFARIETWASLVGAVAVVELIFLGICACWCLDDEEKKLAGRLLRRVAAVLPTS